MPPIPPAVNGKPTEPPKSWKKINEERKALKKQRKQEKLLKNIENAAKLEELAKNAKEAPPPKSNPSTVSIAVPGSILENAQSAELRTYVAGQIARAACIFRVNEIIVFDDVGMATARETKRNYEADGNDGEEGDGLTSRTVRGSSLQLARILQYLECPQYLRKFFFPLHKDLQYSGLLNPLDAPHHLRQQNVFHYREGIICDKKAKEGYSYVNVGLLNDVLVDKAISAGVRVTVKLDSVNDTPRKQRGTVVSPEEPRRETGVYWGYTVRIAHALSEIFTKSPYDTGYDLTVGTSDRGTSVHEVPSKSYAFNHLLIVFGGLKGLEAALANDDKLDVDDPSLLFDHYVNVLPKQGSRTIRTEEALLVAMAALQGKFKPQVEDVEEDLTEFLPRSDDTGMIRPEQFSKKQKKRQREWTNQQQEEQVAVEVTAEVQQSANEVEKTKKRNAFKSNGSADEVIVKPKKLKRKPVVEEDRDVDDLEVVPADESKSKAQAEDLGDLSRFD